MSAQWFGQDVEWLISMAFRVRLATRKHMITDVPTEILEEVAKIIALAARIGVKVKMMDETLGKIA